MSIAIISFFSLLLFCLTCSFFCKRNRRRLYRHFYTSNDISTNDTSSNDIEISIHSDTTEPCSEISSIN